MELEFKLSHVGLWLDGEAHDGCWNMAADEMLLRCCSVPVLRVYSWSRPMVSVGMRFDLGLLDQNLSEVEVVKRPTGGGIVWHGEDQTFTLMVPDAPAFERFNPRQSYQWIHSVLAGCLTAETGKKHLLVQPGACLSGNDCFVSPVAADVVCEGRKIAGGAQRRTKSGFLHQGSLQASRFADAFWLGFAALLADEVSRWMPDEAGRLWVNDRAAERRDSGLWHRAALSSA